MLIIDVDCVVLGSTLEYRVGAIIRWLQGAFD